MNRMRVGAWVLGLLLWQFTPSATAQFAVVDVGAIAQLVQQLQAMRQQLETARNQLTQARQTLDAMRGGRGMERLLEGTVRNYLPPDWAELEAAVASASWQYQRLAAEFQALVNQNAVMRPEDLARLAPEDRLELERARRATAMHQVTTRQALETTSSRFASLQQLVDAISRAADQKAILDLQARIAVEQGMLANEQTKLQMLTQTMEADDRARKQRLREQAMNSMGSLRDLPPVGFRVR